MAVPSLPNAWEGGEGEGGEGRKEVRGTVWERVDLPKGNNTRSLRQKTKGLLAGKRATKEQQRGLWWLISPCSSHTPVLLTGLTAVGGCGGVAVDNCFGAALQFRCLQCPREEANLPVTPHILFVKTRAIYAVKPILSWSHFLQVRFKMQAPMSE